MTLGAALGLTLNWAGTQGLVDAGIVGTVAQVGKGIGDLFLRLLQMLVVPLIVSSLISGITGMGDLRTLGSHWRTCDRVLSDDELPCDRHGNHLRKPHPAGRRGGARHARRGRHDLEAASG